jgi:hypothetical protein
VSTRVISDRELMRQVVDELAELREQVAAFHLRLEALAGAVDLGRAGHSIRVERQAPAWFTPPGELVERLRPYFDSAERAS